MALLTVITFKSYVLFLVNSHMRIPISLIFVCIWARVTLVPDIIMAVYVPIQVSLVLETMITALVLAHETGVS